MKQDTFTVEILADGSFKIETDKISAPNHANASAFLQEVQRIAGGSVTRSRRAKMPQVQQTQDRKENA